MILDNYQSAITEALKTVGKTGKSKTIKGNEKGIEKE
jgi:hypothetical protein